MAASPNNPNLNGQCKCGRYVHIELVSTNVPGTVPVEMWMCPDCDGTNRR